MGFSESKGKILVAFFLAAGIFSTFAYKLQGCLYVQEGEHHKKFFHPYIQSMTMFIGESLCLILYYCQGDKVKLTLEEGKRPHKKWIFIIPAISDALSSMLQYTGLTLITGSTYMMFKGTSIVTTAIFSKILIKMVIEKRHIAGCGLAILGLSVVGSSGLIESTSGEETKFHQELLGYVLMLFSLIFNGFLYAFEQKIMKQHTVHPLEMVGFEGISGICFMTIVLLILSFIPCHLKESLCVFDNDNNAYMELPLVYLREVFTNGYLVFLVISGIISIAMFNFGGVSITKMYDALTRSLLNVTKTAAIWAVGIIITIFATAEEYKLESTNVWVNLIKCVGFAEIILGTLIYNQLVFKKYFGSKIQSKSLLSEHEPESFEHEEYTKSFEHDEGYAKPFEHDEEYAKPQTTTTPN